MVRHDPVSRREQLVLQRLDDSMRVTDGYKELCRPAGLSNNKSIAMDYLSAEIAGSISSALHTPLIKGLLVRGAAKKPLFPFPMAEQLKLFPAGWSPVAFALSTQIEHPQRS